MAKILTLAAVVALLSGSVFAAIDETALVTVYENDFKNRSSEKPIAGVQSFTYDNTGDTFITAGKSSHEGYGPKPLALVQDVKGDGNKPQPLGYDGWRRLHHCGTAFVRIDGGASSDGIRFTYGEDLSPGRHPGYALAAAPIGSKLSSGTMRILVDVKTPNSWVSVSGIAYAMIAIGNDGLYNGLTDANANYPKFSSTGTLGVYGIGIPDNSGLTSNSYPGFLVGTHSDPVVISGRTFDKDKSLTKSKWYRIQLEVDFANSQTTYKLFQHGDTYDSAAANASTFDNKTPVYQRTLPFRLESAPKVVSTIALQVYGLKKNSSGSDVNDVLFDSIRVFAKPDGAAEEIHIYNNPITSRSVTSLTEKARIFSDSSDVTDQDDGFFRKGSGIGKMMLTSGDDPMLQFVFNSNSEIASSDGKWRFAATAQPLGGSYSQSMRVSVDMRPPCEWVNYPDSTNKKQRHMSYALAGEQYRAGTLSTVIGSWFGICNTNAVDKANHSPLSTFFVRSRDSNNNERDHYPTDFVEVDNTHWYRFIADVNPKTSMTTVKIYDLGATKPTKATVLADNATPVATISDVPFYNPRSSIGKISAQIFYCFNGSYSPFDDKYSPLFDNVKIAIEQKGFVMVVK